MHVVAKAFTEPKADRIAGQEEDRHWPPGPVDVHASAFRFAVSDGASGSWRAALWAGALSRQFCRNGFPDRCLLRTLDRQRHRAHGERSRPPRTWYEIEAAARGAHATLIGLMLRDPNIIENQVGRWSALACGDSCLFHVRGCHLDTAFPYRHSAQFSRRPRLLCSRPGANGDLRAGIQRIEGAWQSGDQFFLMSDALARWFLSATERGRAPWSEITFLEATGNGPTFSSWIRQLRRCGELVDDDVTLIRIHVYSPGRD